MKLLAFSLLLLLAGLSLHRWETERQGVLSFCNLAAPDRHFARIPQAQLPPVALTGSLGAPSGRWVRLDSPRWERAGGALVSLPTAIWVDAVLAGKAPRFGRQVRISGPFRCEVPRRNPGRMADGLFSFELPRIFASGRRFSISVRGGRTDWGAWFRQAFAEWLDAVFASAPGILALERSLWMGDNGGLPTSFRTFYQEGGLLHFLALSGLRVVGLVTVVNLLLRSLLGIARASGVRNPEGRLFTGYRYLRRLLPLACCLCLWMTSHGAAPVIRMTAVALAALLLDFRHFSVAPWQRVASSVACLLVWDPGLLASPAFLWSVAATGLLIRVLSGETRGALTAYFGLMALMPILVFPLSAFFAARIAWNAPLHSLAVGWLWELVLVPGGYAAPFLLWPLPLSTRAWALGLAEQGWEGIVLAHERWSRIVGSAGTVVIRPTWLELVMTQLILFFVVIEVRKTCRSMRCFFPRTKVK